METIAQQIEAICSDICDNYCKYPEEAKKAGKDENWLTESEDSPCWNCPLNKIM